MLEKLKAKNVHRESLLLQALFATMQTMMEAEKQTLVVVFGCGNFLIYVFGLTNR